MEEIYTKLQNNEKLSEEEIESLVWDGEQVYEEAGEEHRWQKEMFTVVKVKNKFYGICWMKGLTECQEHEYYEQPFEVGCESKTEVVKKEIWKPINEISNNENKNSLIVIKQLPIIEEQLKKASDEIDEKVNNAVALVCTEENVKTIKEIRATLNKESKEFEDRRKQVKSEIMKPYEDFESSYKKYISDKYKAADIELKNKIDSVENELKVKKEQEIKEYFEEYKQANLPSVDYIKYEQAKISVTLSASMKSLKEQVKAFIDRTVSDLQLIETQQHKTEILVEYKQSLNVSQAITTVANRFKAIEEEKARQERDAKLQKEIVEIAKEGDKCIEAEHVPTIEEIPQMEIEAPLTVPVTEEQEEILTLKFTVKGTRTKLRALKEFLINGGYEYE